VSDNDQHIKNLEKSLKKSTKNSQNTHNHNPEPKSTWFFLQQLATPINEINRHFLSSHIIAST
jgi:hypothetical protein